MVKPSLPTCTTFRVRGYDDADAQRETKRLTNHLLTQPVFDLGMAGGILVWTPTVSGRAFFTQTVDRLFNGAVDTSATTNISDPAKNYLDVTTMPGHVDTNRYSYRVTIRFTNPDTSANHNGAGTTTVVHQFPMLPCMYIKSYARTDPHITVSFGYATDVYSGLGYEVEIRASPTDAWINLIDSSFTLNPSLDEPTVFMPAATSSAFYFRMRAKLGDEVGEWCAQTVGWSLNPPQSDPSALVYDISGDVVAMTFPATPASSPTNTNGTMVAVNHYFESGITDAYQKTSASEWGNVTVVQDQTSHEFGIGITALRTFIDTFDWAGITWNAHDGAVADRTVDKLYCVLFGVGSGLDTYNYLPKYYGIRLVAGHYLDGDAGNAPKIVTPAGVTVGNTLSTLSLTYHAIETETVTPSGITVGNTINVVNITHHAIETETVTPTGITIGNTLSTLQLVYHAIETLTITPAGISVGNTINPLAVSYSSPATETVTPKGITVGNTLNLVRIVFAEPTVPTINGNRPVLATADNASIDVRWTFTAGTENIDSITSIEVLRKWRPVGGTAEPTFTSVVTLEPTAREYVDTGLVGGSRYGYRIKVNIGGYSSTSNQRATTAGAYELMPAGVTVSNVIDPMVVTYHTPSAGTVTPTGISVGNTISSIVLDFTPTLETITPTGISVGNTISTLNLVYHDLATETITPTGITVGNTISSLSINAHLPISDTVTPTGVTVGNTLNRLFIDSHSPTSETIIIKGISVGNTINSPSLTFTAPTVPTILNNRPVVTTARNGSIDLSWGFSASADNVDVITSIEILRRWRPVGGTPDSGFTSIATIAPEARSYTSTGLVGGSRYAHKIKINIETYTRTSSGASTTAGNNVLPPTGVTVSDVINPMVVTYHTPLAGTVTPTGITVGNTLNSLALSFISTHHTITPTGIDIGNTIDIMDLVYNAIVTQTITPAGVSVGNTLNRLTLDVLGQIVPTGVTVSNLIDRIMLYRHPRFNDPIAISPDDSDSINIFPDISQMDIAPDSQSLLLEPESSKIAISN